MNTAAVLSDSSTDRGRRAEFRLIRAKRQTGAAALVLAGGYVAIVAFNILTEHEASFTDYLPNLAAIVLLLASGWLYTRASTPVAWLPWIAAAVSLALVELLLLETWRDHDNPSVEYALIIMVVFSQFVLAFPAAIAAAVPMLVSYVVVATNVEVADLGDASIIGLTALAVGVFSLSLRIRLADSLAIALDSAEALATHDTLTGVLNRRGLAEHIPGMIAAATRRGDAISIAFLDIDRMKPINDIHGHATGDDVIRIVAQALRSSARASDLVARWGGDEFVVVASAEHGLDTDEWVARICDRVRQDAAGHPSWNGGVTVGVAVGTVGTDDWQALVDRADTDMYARKRQAGDV